MKLFLTLGVSLLVAGCCCSPGLDYSLMDISDYPENSDERTEIKPPENFKNNFLSCRANDNARVKSIVDAAKAHIKSKPGSEVVLYFHGGLSSQTYMLDDLGPKLMRSMFSLKSVNDKLYPIFINYDAEPEIWDAFEALAEESIKTNAYKIIKKEILSKIGINDNKSRIAASESTQNKRKMAAITVLGYGGDVNKSKSFNMKSAAKDFEIDNETREYFQKILEAEKLPDEFVKNGKLDADLNRIAKKIPEIKNEINTKSIKSLDVKSLPSVDNLSSALKILRILVRFALKVDHGPVATIQEEVLNVIGVDTYGVKHWNKVKRHSKECFTENSNGRNLVNQLISNNIKINTLSHSAGSIPTAELISYVSKEKQNYKLNNIVMLVPAVNQQVFDKFVVSNEPSFNNIKIYALREKCEKADQVWSKVVYSSSLLYAVSSLAENSKFLDKMLLIDQHLTPNRRSYKYPGYLKAACEKPESVWGFIKPNVNYDLYPFKNNNICPKEIATHEGTKYPWKSSDLARRYLKVFGVANANTLVFPKPK